ncbi:MAG TPA: XRE family transcriptional regulator [Syntrophales bacterium]|jgi:transcriptional regulator with XRE-family HTH domain|nr:XRE family transcriptional regulator [Syntrophales bacterium]HON22616.1 XRE family transcriptional regulator [Syntrophales bacterium]HOU77490.1 XRE family transcriptional regulator [Syntrophales bacterium]HPC31828.1 XRE family transcriptional regulator [Syntrophales bacterium]HQG33481.1 XRE family transcriptional regulator [Syntrophales bacterium]
MTQDDAADRTFTDINIGRKVKELREKSQLTIMDLAAKTGVSKSVLAEIESGDVIPPVATLLKLAKAMNVGMAFFFQDTTWTDKISVTRKDQRIRIRRRPHHHEGEVDYIYESLETRKPDKHMEPLFVEFQPMETGDMVFSSHEGEEFVYLLEGRLEFRSHERIEVLAPGDAIYFDSDLSHAFRGLDNTAARAIVVVWNKP